MSLPEPIDRSLQHAMACAAAATDIEVSYEGQLRSFVRFANSAFTQVGETESAGLRIRVVSDKKLGAAYAASLDPDEVARAATRAMNLAQVAPAMDHAFEFASPGTEHRDSAPSPTPPIALVDAPSRLAKGFASAPSGASFFGALKGTRTTTAVRTKSGVARYHESQELAVEFIARAGDGWGWAGGFGRGNDEIDLEALAGSAAQTAVGAQKPTVVSPAAMDVVLSPAAVAELLEWMCMGSFSGREVLDGTSMLSERHGQSICSPAVSVREMIGPDDAPFDTEGTERQAVCFIDHGRAGLPVSDLLTAARLGRPSTGHAAPLRTEAEMSGPTPAHISMDPGDASLDELVGRVDRGLYVTRLHYVNGLLDTRRATMTGMTRDGTFLIEGGKIGAPVGNLRFTDSILDALSQERLGGIGREIVTRPSWWRGAGLISAPALLLRRFQWSGTSR